MFWKSAKETPKGLQLLQARLEKFKHPGIGFSVGPHTDGLATLRVSHYVDDVNGSIGKVEIVNSYYVPEDITDGMLKSTVRQMLHKLVTHEVDEWLTYDGKNVVNPHPEEDDAA